jgi:hypothetical protein
VRREIKFCSRLVGPVAIETVTGDEGPNGLVKRRAFHRIDRSRQQDEQTRAPTPKPRVQMHEVRPSDDSAELQTVLTVSRISQVF